jgi:ubiquinone biosynthesis monooxygenase Coq6
MTLTQPQYPDLRVSTITPANMQLLQQAGAWQELAPAAPTFQHMQVRSDKLARGSVRLSGGV